MQLFLYVFADCVSMCPGESLKIDTTVTNLFHEISISVIKYIVDLGKIREIKLAT